MNSIGPVVSEEKMFENVDGRRTYGRTDAGVTGILLAHQWAFGSGELIISKFCPSWFFSFHLAHGTNFWVSLAVTNRLKVGKTNVDQNLTKSASAIDFIGALLQNEVLFSCLPSTPDNIDLDITQSCCGFFFTTMEFYKGIIRKWPFKWSFSYNSFVNLNDHFPIIPL